MTSVVRDWVQRCSFKQQTVLLCGLRGCDGTQKEDKSKPIVRWLRSMTLKSAMDLDDNGDRPFVIEEPTFMANRINAVQLRDFLADLDAYPSHWIWHLAHALMVVGFYHPNEEVQEYAHQIAFGIHDAFHVDMPEQSCFASRLADVPNRNTMWVCWNKLFSTDPVINSIVRVKVDDAVAWRRKSNSSYDKEGVSDYDVLMDIIVVNHAWIEGYEPGEVP